MWNTPIGKDMKPRRNHTTMDTCGTLLLAKTCNRHCYLAHRSALYYLDDHAELRALPGVSVGSNVVLHAVGELTCAREGGEPQEEALLVFPTDREE